MEGFWRPHVETIPQEGRGGGFLTRDTLRVGDNLILRVNSSPYQGYYKTQITAVDNQTLTVTMPCDKGKLILLSSNTSLEVFGCNDKLNFRSQVLTRGFKPHPYLVLLLPLAAQQKPAGTRVIAVTSGKGGVGKTTIAINLAIALSRQGLRVFLLDADLGTANIDVLLNLRPKYNLSHVIKRQKELLDIIIEGPERLRIIPGSSGLNELANLKEEDLNWLIYNLASLEQYADIIIIDTGSGVNKNVINFALAANDTVVVSTPEPHALTDAYALIKILDELHHRTFPYLVLNRINTFREYSRISRKLSTVINQYLNLKIVNLGYIFEDHVIPKANKKLEPFLLAYPYAPASHCIDILAHNLLNSHKTVHKLPSSRYNFFMRLKELFLTNPTEHKSAVR